MIDNVEQTADDYQEWFFENARSHPLLTSEEERQIDARKWDARTELLQLFIKGAYCRHFLRQWADQLLHNPPVPGQFEDRQAYLSLRREQTPLLKAKGARKCLQSLGITLGASSGTARYPKRLQTQAETLLKDLNLTTVLAAGMAEYLLQKNDCSETAEGLKQWVQTWPEGSRQRTESISSRHTQDIQQALERYEAARDTLVNHNLRLVFSVAGKVQNSSDSFMDRVQNGIFGLIRAAEKFESSKGFRFSTYAFSWINQSIQRGVEDQRGIVRYPSDVSEKISKMYRERMEFLKKHGREPRELELAKLLDTKPETLFRLRQVMDLSVSIDSPLGEEGEGISLAEKLSSDTFAPPSAQVEQQSLNRRLRHCLKALSEQEQRVVDLRWGLGKSRPLTRKELSAHLQISQERIRQIEVQALEKLRSDRNMIAEYRNQQSMD